MAAEAVHDLGDDQLAEALAQHRSELFELRFKLATGGLENTTKIRGEKKMIARILTELREREIAAAELVQAGTEETS